MTALQTKPPWVSFELLRTRYVEGRVCKIDYSAWQESTPADLIDAKKAIEPLERSHQWELAKKMANPYELVYTLEDKYFHPSISAFKPLSRSYFKLIEMLEITGFFKRLPKQTQNLSSAHIAEGPGGFIQAFLEATEKAKKRVTNSYAMTLRPTNANIPGWKRATFFLQKHHEIKLTYGADDTGNVYKRENQDAFGALTKCSCSLFTADGGFDFSINYNRQENAIFPLLVSSFLTGFKTMRIGAMMIVKIFDIFSEHTCILLATVGRQFQQWTLYKPLTSRPCNSERYFIGIGYKGVLEESRTLLEEIEMKASENLYPTNLGFLEDYERDYLSQHVIQQKQSQLAAIKMAIQFSQNPDDWYDNHFNSHFTISQDWCRFFHIPSVIYTPRPLVRFQPTTMVAEHHDSTSLEDGHPQLQMPDVDLESPRPFSQEVPSSC
jgi:23S rRNA U2552 (ribose-2'-O)-methylase RlmE/FtsJ